MKEYIKPELEVIALVADEKIASDFVEVSGGVIENPFG